MPRRAAAVLLIALATAVSARADAFDHYVNATLARIAEGKHAREVKRLTPAMLLQHNDVLPRTSAAFLVVRTNGGRWAKLLVQAARQKVDGGQSLPILAVDRFVTYKEGEERAVHAAGKDVALYPGFRLSLDLGQVVPEALGGDVRFVADGDQVYAEPVGKARLYLVVRHDPGVVPTKGPKFVMGDKPEPRHFNGTYRLEDDGRRTGTLVLRVGADGRTVRGSYYSALDGAKYEVAGRLGEPRHVVEFTIKFPRAEQAFRGLLFTGDGRAIAGTSRLAGREAAFYALRQE